ncbi:hypothetical protein Acr_00g0017370 [Actinidia rufa]|uniref:Reverse transcriptase Ty1/copia-type domain-containing protein n=1 Tax=Actinidia rufa TaxID=165716 RepID=A0A7J0DBS0_9ERIC|nr:hypothetical protein Acr_00g0017370 [Actinidia rufa]
MIGSTNEFRAKLNKCDILKQLACPYTPEQNGVAKHKNCHIISEILAAHDPIPPGLLPILEPPSSPPTPNGSLPLITDQDPSSRAQAPLPTSSLESVSSIWRMTWLIDIRLALLLRVLLRFRCHSDNTFFIRRQSQGQSIIISIYVDDIIITEDDASGIVQVNCGLKKAFDIKDLGPLCYFLGIEVAQSRYGISLSQQKYSLDLLQDTGMLGCRSTSTPMGTSKIIWLRSLLTELGFSVTDSSYLFCDNKTAIILSSDSFLHERTKHIEVDIHFIRKKVRLEVITLNFVPSSAQTADMFTKSIGPLLLKSSQLEGECWN